jgi:hypothetical protein
MATGSDRRTSAERLEPRALLAGDLRAGVDLGLLSVTGDEADNAVVVTRRLERHRAAAGNGTPALREMIVVTGLPRGGARTTVNGAASASFPADQVQDVVIDMAGGDDYASAVGLRLDGVLAMDGGDFGNDALAVVFCRVDRLGIRTGPGDDRLTIVRTAVAGLASLTGEDGRDALFVLGSTFGSTEIRNFEFVFPPTLA